MHRLFTFFQVKEVFRILNLCRLLRLLDLILLWRLLLHLFCLVVMLVEGASFVLLSWLLKSAFSCRRQVHICWLDDLLCGWLEMLSLWLLH